MSAPFLQTVIDRQRNQLSGPSLHPERAAVSDCACEAFFFMNAIFFLGLVRPEPAGPVFLFCICRSTRSTPTPGFRDTSEKTSACPCQFPRPRSGSVAAPSSPLGSAPRPSRRRPTRSCLRRARSCPGRISRERSRCVAPPTAVAASATAGCSGSPSRRPPACHRSASRTCRPSASAASLWSRGWRTTSLSRAWSARASTWRSRSSSARSGRATPTRCRPRARPSSLSARRTPTSSSTRLW